MFTGDQGLEIRVRLSIFLFPISLMPHLSLNKVSSCFDSSPCLKTSALWEKKGKEELVRTVTLFVV